MATVEDNTKGRCRPKLTLAVVQNNLAFLNIMGPNALDRAKWKNKSIEPIPIDGDLRLCLVW